MNLLHCLSLSSNSDCVFVSHLCCAAKGQLKSCVLLQRPKQTLTVQAHVIIEIITKSPIYTAGLLSRNQCIRFIQLFFFLTC